MCLDLSTTNLIFICGETCDKMANSSHMIFLVWICPDLVYQLECLLYDIRKLCALVFHFLIFLNFLCRFESWSNPRFDQDLNKYRTWKWKEKPVSFLVTPKWSFWEVFEFSMFETQNHFSTCFWLHKIEFRVRGRYMIFLRIFMPIWILVKSLVWPRFKQV